LTSQLGGSVLVFFSYAHKDEDLRDELAVHLAMLKREGAISDWHDRQISPGREWGGEIDAHLEVAHVILLLVSPDFLASDYCYDVEVKTAMHRHEAGEARVVPVILRPCDWSRAPFGKLQALPKNAEPVTRWADRDEAFLDVAKGIRRVADEMAAAAAPAPAPGAPQKSAVSSTIPRSPAIGFVSRRDDQGRDILTRLREELSPEGGRLVAVWGPGGSGKTTLAAEAARHLSATFPGRVVWTSALGRSEFTLSTLLDDIAAQLDRPDLRQMATEDKGAAIRDLMGDAPTLVIFDNFEAVARVDGSDEQARCLDFLAACGECPALLTTRDFIDRPDIVNVRLAAMEIDEAREFLDRLIEKSGRPKAFTGLNRDELIRECEANPLVMQWVVSRVALARRVRDVLTDLKQGEGDAAKRVFERSFMLPQVGDDGRAALLALSLFAPDASRESLANVSGFGDDLRRLNRTVERLSGLWLVEATPGHERLFLQGLTRELTRSRLLGDKEATAFQSRFISYFVAYAEAHSEASPENYDALEAEKDNLLGAADLAFLSHDWDSVRTIAATCGLPSEGMLSVRGWWDEAIRLNQRALDAVRVSDDKEWIAYFSLMVGSWRDMRGETAEAKRLLAESLDIYRSLGDEQRLSHVLHGLGMIAQREEDRDQAKRLFRESLGISRREKSGTLHQLAMIALDEGDLEEAYKLYQESLGIKKKLGHQHGIATSLHELGMLAQRKGEFREARDLYTQSIAIKRAMRNKPGEALSLAQLATLEAKEGNLREAVEHSRQAEEIMVRLGNQENVLRIREQRERFQGLLREHERGKVTPDHAVPGQQA
jgi:tetratricopeptide (TPR) repeat protein